MSWKNPAVRPLIFNKTAIATINSRDTNLYAQSENGRSGQLKRRWGRLVRPGFSAASLVNTTVGAPERSAVTSNDLFIPPPKIGH
jgi:hypothetical protein